MERLLRGDTFRTTFDEQIVFSQLEPRTSDNNAIIIEFNVQEEDEKELTDTVKDALRQIMERHYKTSLVAKGI